MSIRYIPPIVVPAVKAHTATVIFVHGLGDSGAGWVDFAENWRRRSMFNETKFVFPNAPMIPITINGGMRMPGWFDIASFGDLRSGQDEVGILRTREYLYGLIDEEIKAGTPSERIILGGFSQGAAMSLFAGTTYKHKLGGIIGLSGFLPCNDKIEGLIPEGNANKDTPILMCHGDQDPVVLPTWGRMSAEFLKKGGWKVDYKEYRGLVHSASPQEIDDVATFLQGRIPDQK